MEPQKKVKSIWRDIFTRPADNVWTSLVTRENPRERKMTTQPTSKQVVRIHGGVDGSRLKTFGSEESSFELVVLGVWLHLSNMEIPILKARMISVILVICFTQ